MKIDKQFWIWFAVVAGLHFAATVKLPVVVEHLWETQPYSFPFTVAAIAFGMFCTPSAVVMIWFNAPDIAHWHFTLFVEQSILYACLFCIPIYMVREHRKCEANQASHATSEPAPSAASSAPER